MLTSIKNPKVAAAVRLKKRAFREEDRCFLVEGAQGVGEALEHPADLRSLFVVDDLDPLAVRARHAGVDVHAVSDDVMGKLTSTVTPQGIVGVSPFLDVAVDTLSVDGCIAILHEVRDPGNAGTVLRSADAAGADGVVFTASSVDPYNPKTVRSSAGSIFHLPIVRGEETASAVRRSARSRTARSSRWTGTAIKTSTRSTSAIPPRSCSATRPTDCPKRSWRWRMRGCGCRTGGRPSRSTWPRPPPCACSNGPVADTAAPSRWRPSWPQRRTTSARRSRR